MDIIKPTLMATMLAFLSVSTTICATESQTRTSMHTHHTTLWQLIEALIDHPSFTLDTIRQVLPVEFAERSNNGSASFYEGGPLHLADHVVIKKATLAIRHKTGVSRLIGLDLDPDTICVTINDVEAHYPEIEIADNFYGKKTYWAVQYPWGRLTFGEELNQRCLTSVGIRRNDPSPTSPSP